MDAKRRTFWRLTCIGLGWAIVWCWPAPLDSIATEYPQKLFVPLGLAVAILGPLVVGGNLRWPRVRMPSRRAVRRSQPAGPAPAQQSTTAA